MNRYPKEEPHKKYLYTKSKKLKESDKPYKTQLISKIPFEMKMNKLRFFNRAQALKVIRKLNGKGDKLIDDHLIRAIRTQNFSAAF